MVDFPRRHCRRCNR